MFHLKVSLRFEDGIVETISAIYECNYVLIVGRYVVFWGMSEVTKQGLTT